MVDILIEIGVWFAKASIAGAIWVGMAFVYIRYIE